MTFYSIKNDRTPCPETVEKSIESIEEMLGISITIHDAYGKLMLRPGTPILPGGHRSHRKNFLCGIGFCQKCSSHCGIEANRRAAESEMPFIHECWKGLSEIVIPLHLDGMHAATFFAGTWRAKGKHAIKFKGRTSAWLKQRAALPLLSPAEAERQISLLSVFAMGIFRNIQTITGGEYNAPTREMEIKRFLRLNNPASLNIDNLAKTLHLSPSRASHIVHDIFGKSFRELLKNERIERSKSLLATTDLPVKEIAIRAGIDDQYYFSRLFRRETGRSPSGYRKHAAGKRFDILTP